MLNFYDFLFASILLQSPVATHQLAVAAIGLEKEPHHHLIFKNNAVRVYSLRLKPGEATLPHQHKTFYTFVSLKEARISNLTTGHKPHLTVLLARELHISKGGFTVIERNAGPDPVEVVVVEVAKPAAGKTFTMPMGGFESSDALYSELYQEPFSRGYAVRLSAGGSAEFSHEPYDQLLIALTDLKFHAEAEGGDTRDMEMKAGEVQWIPSGMFHTTSNTGPSHAEFIVLDFLK